MKSRYSDLRAASERILASADSELRREIDHATKAKRKPGWAAETAERMRRLVEVDMVFREGPARRLPDFVEESIIQRVGRPVFAVARGQVKIKFEEAGAKVWKRRLEASANVLAPAIAAVGRVELTNHPMEADYAGTGWLVEPDIVVTNRHVALEFAQRTAAGFGFRIGFDRRTNIAVNIDFLEEIGSKAEDEIDVRDIIFINNDSGPDVAFLRLANPANRRPVKLATQIPAQEVVTATIGYPAKDSRVPDQALMNSIFGGVYDKKRLAPGFIIGRQPGTISHDCTTLGGNSGSLLVDLQNGEAIGLHFSGQFLKANFAVPAPSVTQLLREARNRPPVILTTPPKPKPPAPPRPAGRTGSHEQPRVTSAGGFARLTIPIEISLQIGVGGADIQAGAAVAPDSGDAYPGRPLGGPATREQVRKAVAQARAMLAQRADVLGVEAGYRFSDGWITDEQVVVIYVRRKRTVEDLDARGVAPLPTEILGVPTDVAVAPAAIQLPGESAALTEARAKVWVSNYQPRPDLPLAMVQERMKVIVHASPDAGWPILKEFLRRTRRRLTIGIYDFTAPHVLDAVKAATRARRRSLDMVIQAGESLNDGTKKDDIPDDQTVADLSDLLGQRFNFAWASVKGPDRLFDSSYHIKVAVRDGTAFWLSSGNWQSSNQPDHDPIGDGDQSPPMLRRFNREWHAVIEHPGLADIYERHLKRDLTEAAAMQEAAVQPGLELWVPVEYFQPSEAELEAPVRYVRPLTVDREVRVQPLLTPDNYADQVRTLIRSARERVYFQNQSFSVLEQNTPAYQALLEALLEQQEQGLDVRMIFRRFGDMRKNVTALKKFGFNTDLLRLQTNCHTKGIIVDGKVALIGSHNWTNAGTVFNRDASLIFHDQQIAAYFENLFLYDWNRIGRPRIDEGLPAVEIVTGLEGAPRAGMVRVAAEHWFGE